jgi:alpha-pyrone synthase
MDIGITAVGTANPSYKIQQNEVVDKIIAAGFNLKPSERRLLRFVYKSSGIETRYSVLSDYSKKPGEFKFFSNDPDQPFPSTASRMKVYKDNALALCLSAIENCLLNFSEFDCQTITHLITISCTGMYAPGIDIEIVQKLHLNPSTKRTTVNFMGCYGVFNGIKLAYDICKANKAAKVLVVSVELCTIHFQKKMSLDNIISNAIFADGAGAVLIESEPPHKKYFALKGFHCDLLPQTSQEMAWHVGDQGFDIVLSSYVPEVIQKGITNFTENLLQTMQLNFKDIDIYAIHPGGLKILEACETSLNIGAADNRYAYQVLRHYGNMSSATILFVLKNIWEDDFKPNKNIFSCAFGPGLTLESMLLETHYV